jgi:N utilization substance protein B
MSNSRSNARQAAVQALYQWQVTGQNVNLIARQFAEEDWLKGAQKALFSDLLHGVPEHLGNLDTVLNQFTDRPIEQVDLVERAILRLGTYELLHHIETPYKVILNECINLAKTFGADGSHRYINGILDKIAQEKRTTEIKK